MLLRLLDSLGQTKIARPQNLGLPVLIAAQEMIDYMLEVFLRPGD